MTPREKLRVRRREEPQRSVSDVSASGESCHQAEGAGLLISELETEVTRMWVEVAVRTLVEDGCKGSGLAGARG